MSNQQPIKVCEEAFLRCAPWTPITFRLQRYRIVKTGEKIHFVEAIKCLEAFGIRSDIDSVCAHLRTFKDSEIAKRVFCNIRERPQQEPWSLPAAVDLSVSVEAKDTMAYRAKKIFKEFLRVFLSLCQNLIEDNQSLEQRLKGAFIDVFEGLTDSNFSLEPHWSKKRILKQSSICYAIRLVHRSHREFPDYYKTMISDLAFLAPKNWGMYQRGNKYRGHYTKWDIPETFSGFELDTESDTPRDWDAMQGERIVDAERSTLLSRYKRTRLADSFCPQEEGSSLPKMSRTERSNLTLRQFTPSDIVDESPPSSRASSPLEEESLNYEGLDINRESDNIEDDVVTRNTPNMDTDRPLIFISQPSTSREDEEPSTSRQGATTLAMQESTSRQEERPSTSYQGQQSSATLNDPEVRIEDAPTISTVQTNAGLDVRDDLSVPSTMPDLNSAQEEETTPQGTRDVTTERSAGVRVVQTNDITVSSGSATGGCRQTSFAMENARILKKASQTPDAAWFLDECIAEMIEQKFKQMRKKYDN
ncbi:uncharacterized protein LOC112556503 [Pomacea canaliculata]|uniref:uncharacterized protein LOC112556503 n=1 Tax=Pomacea canaliculata TaxID=400727 RepID=UPI000D72F5A5|nr:uncharacterized protein LOC112556503 [Pomacea canaliculata]